MRPPGIGNRGPLRVGAMAVGSGLAVGRSLAEGGSRLPSGAVNIIVYVCLDLIYVLYKIMYINMEYKS